MPIKLNSVVLFNPFISYSYFLTLGLMPIILIVFYFIGNNHAIGTELLRGTGPQWLAAADGNIVFALVGKLLPYTFIFSLIAILMNVIFDTTIRLAYSWQKCILYLSANFY